jgi:GNAT superfamily N-acetyltransferase
VRTGRVIREAIVDDIPVLVEMGMRFAQSDAYKRFVRDNPVQFEEMARMLITSGLGVILVLEKNGCVEGMIGMLCTPHFLSGDMFAGEICWWINPEHRGDGVRLMKFAETWAREHGALSIQMVAPNERVGRLYKRMGYQQTEVSYQKQFDTFA